ncbi:hypothetical protein CERSUDRAFT_117427 [Gelatoporia subvermispora B]|uniref:GATA-type domain-containing protein n=1 Tax=Ceriporiopsis subvermispora (strain B) TaxID=914234 RepID=M2QAF1_CERS8|nr:hypothetical protein CERSUDRAFT_117427 [Gelatoporia subvermispora B]
MASAHHSYSHQHATQQPNIQTNDFRLPSIKDLNFQYRSPPNQTNQPLSNGASQSEHTRPPPPRHDSSWARPSSSSAAPANGQPAPHEQSKARQYYPPKSDAQYATPGVPLSQQNPSGTGAPNGSNAGPARGDAPPPAPSKRPRSPVNQSPAQSPHTPYPPHASYPPPPAGAPYHPAAVPVPLQSPHEAPHQPAFSHSPPGYSAYPPPPHMAQRHYAVSPPHPPPPAGPVHSYHPPPPPQHWQHGPPPPPPQQVPPPHQANGFARTTPLVPANVEARNAPPAEIDKVTAQQSYLHQLAEHCSHLYAWSNRYAHMQVTMPHLQPPPPELAEMNWRANMVARILDELRRLTSPDQGSAKDGGATSAVEEHSRPPKRPWEEASRDEEGTPAPNAYPEVSYPQPSEKVQSTAEQDMEIIRSKRATSTGGSAPGQPKSKYRKRSRATPPGKCHSCNIRETPEWRRGPDGARTLCNACGLHYAKLMRKREKASADGKAAPIDMQTLRASTASARGSEHAEPAHGQPQMHLPSPVSTPASYDHPKHAPPVHQGQHHSPTHPHAGAYQLMPPPGSGQHQMMPPPPPPSGAHAEGGAPPPPWMTSSSRAGYAPADHQSYLRTPAHGRGSPH